MPAETGPRYGEHRPVSQGEVLQSGVEQAQDPDPQPPPRPRRHQHGVADVDATIGQVALDQRPLAEDVAPGQTFLALGAFRGVVDPAWEARGVAGFTRVVVLIDARRAALFAGTEASPEELANPAAASSPIAK